jgi:hypothetical protein
MGESFKVKVQGHVVEWKDGQFYCNNRKYQNKLRESCDKLEEMPYIELGLDGSTIYAGEGIRPEKSAVTALAFLQTYSGEDTEAVSGDVPSWEKIGYSVPEKSVT